MAKMADKIPTADTGRRFLDELHRGPFTLVTGLFWLTLITPKILQWTGLKQWFGADFRAVYPFVHGGLFLALSCTIIALAGRAWLRTRS